MSWTDTREEILPCMAVKDTYTGIFVRIVTYDTYFIILCLFYFTIFRFLNCILCSTAFYLHPVTYTLLTPA